MKWMITVSKEVAEKILSGKQQVYFAPKITNMVYKDDAFFMCEKGSGGKVVGMFIVASRLYDSPNAFWNNYGNLTGCSEEEFFKYCEGKHMIHGVRIKQAVAADKQYTLSDFGLSQPPTDIAYVS